MKSTQSQPATQESANRTMKAIVQHRYGSTDTLELGSIGQPEIAKDEVLVEVDAAGVDRGTWHLMAGLPYLIRVLGFGFTKPKHINPGFDVAGRVVAVGDNVTRFATGDQVFGIAKNAYAEFAAASENKLALRPANITSEQAGVAAISGITALQALTDVGRLQPGQQVLIIGASGGVGSYAVQLAKALGGEVTGVASSSKLEMVWSLGADHVVDYTTDDFAASATRYDLIIDTGGRNSLSRLRGVLAADGTLVIVGGEGGNRLTGGIGRQIGSMVFSVFTRQRLKSFISKEHFSHIERLAEHMESGDVVPAIGQRFDLAEVAEAIRQLEAGESSGKSVIVVRQHEVDDAS